MLYPRNGRREASARDWRALGKSGEPISEGHTKEGHAGSGAAARMSVKTKQRRHVGSCSGPRVRDACKEFHEEICM
jgi:hypothetical protein